MDNTPPLELLEAICAIDSRSIDGAAGTVSVARTLGEQLEAMGFELEWVDPSPEENPRGRHLKATRNPHAQRQLLLLGHVDTVLGPHDAPYRYDQDAGWLYGCGVCDMKGGCVVMLEAIRSALEASQAAQQAGLTVLLNCTEEIAGPSFRTLARQTATDADACLSFEPARPGADDVHQIVVGRKGVVRLQLHCIGRAAHAGNDHRRGVNSIREVARKIEQLEALTDHQRGLAINVGQVQGGRAGNQVPGQASAKMNVRAFDREGLDALLNTVRSLCQTPSVRSEADGTTTRLSLSENESYPPWPRTPGTSALAQRYGRFAARRSIDTEFIHAAGGSDASHVADLTPTLDGLGVLGGAMHSPDEWADATTLIDRARIAGDMIAELAHDSEMLTAPQDTPRSAAASA